MRAISIRWRLTLWYGIVLAAVLLAFGVAVYFIMSHHLMARIDASLREELAELEEEIRRAANREELLEELSRRFARHEGFEFQVSNPDGPPLFRSVRLRTEPLPVPKNLPSDREIFANHSLGRLGRWRVVSRWSHGPEGTLMIQAAASMAPYDHEVGELLMVLLLAGPLALCGALGGGYLLAHKALAPVDRMAATASQITARRLEQRLPVPNPHDELGHLATTLNGMIQRLQNSFQQMRRFTADAAHELRTPLTVIRNEVEVTLRTPRSPEEYRHVLESLLEETDRLARMADGLLFLCREDTGLRPLNCHPVRLDQLAREIAEHMAILAHEKGVILQAETQPVTVVHGDPDHLRQLLFNLLDNAIKYTPTGGTVIVKSQNHDDQVQLTVSDTGIGIPSEHLPHVFDRFYRVDPARSREPDGAGLGLAICRSIVQAHGGRIDLESTVGEGTRVTVTLPGSRGDVATPG